MISYLQHDAIERDRWDDCIARSLNRRVYAFSWYLDCVAPGWEALVAADYSSVFPLTGGRKAGVSYLFQPFFAQQLGLFSTEAAVPSLASEFFNAIPQRFRLVDIQLTPSSEPSVQGAELIRKVNHELKLGRPYEEMSAAYSQNTRRNLRKASEAGVVAGQGLGAAELVKLFRDNFGEREGKLKDIHYKRMESLIMICIDKGTGQVRQAFDRDGRLSAAAFFLEDLNRIYFLFAASAPSARENGAMFFLIDRFISEHSGTTQILDFEGGNEASLGRFYKSFGADEVTYRRLTWNRLPFLLNAGFKLKNVLGKRVKQLPL